MKKVTVLSSLLIAGALTFTGVQGTAQADEEEGAKTVWGEVLPADTDPDGDGWANTGFDPTWMSQEGQNRISGLAESKDNGEISQVEFNEAVAEIFQIEQARQMDGPNENANAENASQEMVPHQKVDAMDIDVTKENLAKLALYSPAALDAAPVQEEPYNYNFVYGDYGFHFSYDGDYWNWSYSELMQDFTDDELLYLVHNNPEVLNENPVQAGKYNFKISDDNYVYHFMSDGKKWEWSYEEK
ncbi:putative transglycosylase IsaA precursor [Jeotgalicoccus aerolatus]|uniref:Transglycosylase IsaA n=1 Tax=Jeotgalicoccus aerolatus TaxID=709510 RepID=A0ABS4HQ03_9STAP|nr:hypothetical protein [Jeotgalicoccus aerolatus]MBP1953017.1 hypothetical protein [Jeotgalicoccus aerolatus]GGE01835.1 hypothetical protein GCM10007273_12930 [Jeotgalicoccus aerolatus]CAD2073108.1 putative transglycosylase IsaA precursor [Jeotgalicoccus aerolatus]